MESPCLFVVLHAHELLTMGARIGLDDVDEVRLARGKRGLITRGDDGSIRRVDVHIADSAVSRRHGRIRRLLGDWWLEVDDSKNGSFVNGAPVKQARLADGDWIEIGHTFFRFRDVSVQPDDPSILDGTTLVGADRRLTSLLPSLSRRFEELALVASGRSIKVFLVEGETGTGKEVVARAIHDLSGRSGPFIPVQCGALPSALAVSELLGHERGPPASVEGRIGLLRAADRGTLFLDGLGDLPREAQLVLVRVLDESNARPPGGTGHQEIDVRLVLATDHPLDRIIHDGRLRADLLYRPDGHRIVLPPLRDRMEDLGLHLRALMLAMNEIDVEHISFARQAARALLEYDWPGNVRELEKVLRTAVSKSEGPIRLTHLPRRIQEARLAAGARATGKKRPRAQQKLEEHGVESDDFRD